MASLDSATSSAGENQAPAQDGTTTAAPPNVFQLQNRRFFLFVAHITQANKYLEELIQHNKVQQGTGQGRTDIRPPPPSRSSRKRELCLKELRQRLLRATRQGPAWYERNRHCSWVPCLAPHRGLEVCHKGTHRESHQTPCHSCLPNRTCRSRRSAHPCSSFIVSKRIMHPWEGTIRQQIASYVDHQRRTARLARGCAAYASQIAPCRSVMIQVRTVHACSYHPSCDPWRAMSSAEAAQAMSKELQLSLGPDAGPNEDSTQDGEAARTRVPRSPECHDRDIDLMGAEDGPKGSSNPYREGGSAESLPNLARSGRSVAQLEHLRGFSLHERPGQEHTANLRPPVAQVRAKQGRLLAPTSSQDWSQLRCREARAPEAQGPEPTEAPPAVEVSPARIRPPPQPKHKSLFEALKEKLHQASPLKGLLIGWVSWVVLLQERLELWNAYLPSQLAVEPMRCRTYGGVEEILPFWLRGNVVQEGLHRVRVDLLRGR